MSDPSFQEKSVWGSFLALAGFSVYYFASVFGMYRSEAGVDTGRAGELGISLLVGLVVIEIVYHAVIAGSSGSAESDERDRWIETRASRNRSRCSGSRPTVACGCSPPTTAVSTTNSPPRSTMSSQRSAQC